MENTAGKSDKPIYKQEQLLNAVAFSAKELLSTNNWASRIDEILRKLGEASDSSRVYVFKHTQKPDGKLFTSLVFEWCAQGIERQMDNRELIEMEIGAVGFQRWIDLMSSGESVSGSVESFPIDEQALLEAQSIQALAVIPFFVSGKWWGFLGFDQCDRIRAWSEAELGALQAAASMIGSAIERQISEAQLQQQFKELQKTNQELDHFVYSVSHDLRAPLASILGLINVASMEDLHLSQHTYLTRMRDSVHKLDVFIKEVLDYSQNSRTHIKREPIDLKLFLTDLGKQKIPLDKNISLKIDYHGETDILFHSDKKRLEIIFDNLFSNAINFRDTQKAPHIHVTIHMSLDGASIQFKDNGIGIEATHLENIFQMFYRATEHGTGSGLGLYIVKEVIQKLGGWIKVSSEQTNYTEFSLWIPSSSS